MIAADGLPDDRVTCGQCRLCIRGHCQKKRQDVIEGLPLRCVLFEARRTEEDQRTGLERWPTLTREILEVRALDAAPTKR